MEDVQQVEILPGPASTVFGNNAFGGVINLVTGPDYSKSIRLRAEGGSYNTFNLSMNVSQNLGKHGLFFSINRKKSDGHIDMTSFESVHLQAGWQYVLNNNWSVSLQGRYVPYKFDDPSRGNIDNLNLGTYGEIKRGTGELIIRNSGDKLKGSTQVYANFGHHEFFDGFKSDDRTLGFSSYQNYIFNDKVSVAAGNDIIYYSGQASNAFQKMPNGQAIVNGDSHRLSGIGLYLVGFYNPLQSVSIKGGIRYQYNTLPLTNIAPTLGASFNVYPGLNLFVNYQSGFRSPTLMELYLFPSANEDLKAQKINSIEFGSMYKWGMQNSLRISLFQNKADNLIQTVPNQTPPPPETFQNSGKANQWGIEGQLKQNISDDISISLGYSYLDPDNLTLYNPKHQIKYMVFWNYNNFSFIAYGKYVQQLYAANDFKDHLPDYNIVNATASYKIMQHEVYIRLNNILDRKYFVLKDYRAPGFNWSIGSRLNF